MAFRIREITIHLVAGAAPCMPASPDVQCPAGTCGGTAKPACKGKSSKQPHPQDDGLPGGGKKRSLDLLRASLREALVLSPV